MVTLPRVNYRLDLDDTCGDNHQDYSYFPEIGGPIFVGIEGGYDDSALRIGSLALLADLTKSVRLLRAESALTRHAPRRNLATSQSGNECGRSRSCEVARNDARRANRGA